MPKIAITDPQHADLIRDAIRFFQGRADPAGTDPMWAELLGCVGERDMIIDIPYEAGLIEHGLITLAWQRRQDGDDGVADLADEYADRISRAFGREVYRRPLGYPWPKRPLD